MARKIEVTRYKCAGKVVDKKVSITFKSHKSGQWVLWKHVAPYIKELVGTSYNKASMPCRHNWQWSSISKIGICKKCGARSE